ncbi:methyl-accepting chemotaxis protein [Burkholderiales bacterium JOSHI_001]|nr:methyl-accepting chemotaxis protein [Burkholderiales bacterium JOSHI_001]
MPAQGRCLDAPPVTVAMPLPPPKPLHELPPAGAAARWLAVGAVGLVLLMWLLAVGSVLTDRAAVLRQAETDMANLSRAYAEHVAKSMQGADQALRFLRKEYGRMNLALDIRSYLQDESIIQSDFHQLGVIGADGFLSHSSLPFQRVDLHEREHFKVHVQVKDDRLFISKPVLGKASGKWSLQLTRRINTFSGDFGGVVVLSMPPSYFSGFFESASQGEDVVTTLTGLDGVVRARAPQTEGDLGRDVRDSALFQAISQQPQGVVRAHAEADPSLRIWAFRQVQPYGLVVQTGIAVNSVLAPWRQRSLAVLLGVLVASGGVGALVHALLQRMRQQARLVAALQDSSQQLHNVVGSMLEGSGKVAGAGVTMSVSAQQLAIRTDQQGSFLATTSQGVREAVQQVQATAEHAQHVDQRCAALRTQAHDGRAVVLRSVQAIEGIAQQSRHMGEAVSLIEAIAFQTNILALNAAVEAARAGESGRAFAVVAGEVRDLAGRSRQAAGQVRELIARANEQVALGVSEGAAVREVLAGIAGGVDAVADEMRSVAGEAQQQSQALLRVMNGLDELAQLTRSNADMVAESVMAAEDMRDNAQHLRNVVAGIDSGLAGPAAGPAAAATALAPAPASAPAAEAAEAVEFF